MTDDPNVEADVTVDLSHTASGADEYASLMTATVEMTIPGFEVDGKTVTLLVPEERLVTAPSGVRVYLPVAVATTTMVSIRAVAVDELPPAGPPPGFREGNVPVDIKLLGNGAMLPSAPARDGVSAGGGGRLRTAAGVALRRRPKRLRNG